MPELINETIETISSYLDDYDLGICIKTDKQTIKFLINRYTNCCEDFGVDMVFDGEKFEYNNMDHPNDKLSGRILESVRWIHKIPFTQHALTVEFKTRIQNKSMKKFRIIIWNDHNGYYPHEYKINWNDFYDTDDL